ncbi:MAG: GNAT family N-acetyltransferase [Beutenbergiaceae bacterium]
MARWPWRDAAQPDILIRDARHVDLSTVLDFCHQRPVEAALLGEHVEAMLSAPQLRDQLLCVSTPAGLQGLCWTGGNLVPLNIAPAALPELAEHVRRRGRRYSSIVGPADQVMGLWQVLRGHWRTPRDVRPDQPSMVIDHDPLLAPDPLVRLTGESDLDVLMPACVSMFTEEVGYSPLSIGGGYERRVRSLVRSGRSLARIEGGRVIFKAELGTVALGVTQVQGVWVEPELRGQGLAKRGMASVVAYARSQIAPTVSLYVNSYNNAAIAAYEAVGFTRHGTFATVLF